MKGKREKVKGKKCGFMILKNLNHQASSFTFALLPFTFSRKAAPTNQFASAVKRHRVQSSKGFTLIEVMAALAILVLFLVPLLGAVSQGLQFVGRARQRTEALQLAQDKMAEVEMMPIPDAEGTEDGDFGREYPGWRWQVESVRPPIFQLMEQQFAGFRAMEIHVTVFYDEAGTERTIQLDGIVTE